MMEELRKRFKVLLDKKIEIVRDYKVKREELFK